MEEILLWLTGIIVSAVITLLINDPLKYVLVVLFGGGYTNTQRSLRGIWKGRYDYSTEGVVRFEEHYFAIRQIGKYVVIRTLSKGSAWYKLRGKLDQQSFITGTWEERTPDARFYHGAFQLTILPPGNEMNGKWVGYNRRYVVMSGSWHFKRESLSIGKEEIARYAVHQGWPQQKETEEKGRGAAPTAASSATEPKAENP